MLPSLRRTALGVASAVVCLGLVWTVRAQEPQTFNVTLSHAEVSHDPTSGQTIVTMPVRGDLPGVLTLGLKQNAAGTVTGGEWSLVVSYSTTTSSDGTVTVDPVEEIPHGQPGHTHGADALVQKGVIKGSVDGGTLSLNTDGSLRSLNDIVLSVTAGTLQYATATSGNGLLSGTNLSDRATSSGAASIVF
jgi:hypothetical protein